MKARAPFTTVELVYSISIFDRYDCIKELEFIYWATYYRCYTEAVNKGTAKNETSSY